MRAYTVRGVVFIIKTFNIICTVTHIYIFVYRERIFLHDPVKFSALG